MISVTTTNQIIAKVFQDTAFSFVGYLGLCTGDPGQSGANELAGTGYARQSLSAAFQNPAALGQLTNSVALTYLNLPTATVTFFGIWDAATSGNFIQGGSITQATAVGPASAFLVSTGMLVLQFSDAPQLTCFSTYLRNKVLDYMYRRIDFHSSPVFSSLHTASPGQTGANELAGRSYARQQVTVAAPASGTAANTSDLVFLDLPAADVSYVGGFDQTAAGNLLISTQLTVSGSPSVAHLGAGDALAFLAGTYSISGQ